MISPTCAQPARISRWTTSTSRTVTDSKPSRHVFLATAWGDVRLEDCRLITLELRAANGAYADGGLEKASDQTAVTLKKEAFLG